MDKNLAGMTLKKAMNFIPGNVILHIGSRSGFTFVGRKNQYWNDIEKINKNLIVEREVTINNSSKLLYREVRKIVVPDLKVSEIKKSIGKIRTYYESIESAKKYISTFVPLESRKIIKIYPRLQKDGIVIILSGSECGDFWDIEEYGKRVDKNDGKRFLS